MEQRNEQNLWNFLYVIAYITVFVVLLRVLFIANGELPRSISLSDFTLLALASFRLVRLVVYDKVMRWLRDIFGKFSRGPGKTLYDLLTCPWCFGVWAATGVAFFYFWVPNVAWFPIFVLAVAGIASLFQIMANMIGWTAERGKLEVKHREEPS